MKTIRMHITGVVQGVGFRPFVYNLATDLKVNGWVLNGSDGVHIVVEGPARVVEAFEIAVENQAPPAAKIDAVKTTIIESENYDSFEIRNSAVIKGRRTFISPDLATCPACERELFDPSDRRHRYPFINCTDCGPRFTIIEDIPYDRPSTTMKDFPLCPACETEYTNARNRRFHAQPNACFECGPRLYLNWSELDPHISNSWVWSPAVEKVPRPARNRDEEAARSNSIILEVVEALHDDKIVAIKGLGGFQLACNAKSEIAVEKLRERKHRWGKPLAVMFPNVHEAAYYCDINEAEADILGGSIRPIVLAKRIDAKTDNLARSIAPRLCELGIMLPYTPLHHLILDEFAGPLVMTSANLSDEPIAIDNAEALSRLGRIADVMLLHDRAIYSRYDDSVVRVVDGEVQIVRRARGYAPYPMHSPIAAPAPILAVGPEQKNTFALMDEKEVFVSQHIGDLENSETLDAFEETGSLYQQLFRIRPRVIAHDLHPEYLSTKWAKVQDEEAAEGVQLIGVQHHHAHIVATSAEYGIEEPVIGLAFDGTGYGEDGKIWGGEVLIGDWKQYWRFATLRPLPLPGGAGAVKHPIRTALAMLSELDLLGHPAAHSLRQRIGEDEERTILSMMQYKLNTPYTTSMGRLFDAVAALLGIADIAAYEGEPAILLEAASKPLGEIGVPPNCRFGITDAPAPTDTVTSAGLPIPDYAHAKYIIDPCPLIKELLDGKAAGVDKGELARWFHIALTNMMGEIVTKAVRVTGIHDVVLSGGCMMNRLVVEQGSKVLKSKGLNVLVAKKLPVNDGCISFGQAVSAAAQLECGDSSRKDV